jgi:hypothetical protein
MISSNAASNPTVAVRLEGGIGDHILGMRVLSFVKRSFPNHRINAYCDCSGAPAQLEIAKLSPLVDEVIPVFKDESRIDPAKLGDFEQLRAADQAVIRAADVFIDAWGGSLFIPQSRLLNVSFYEILNSRPALSVAPCAADAAENLIAPLGGAPFVVLQLSKYGPDVLRSHAAWLGELLCHLLKNPRLTIFNVFTTAYDFPHFPQPYRQSRSLMARDESKMIADLCKASSRIVPLVDLPITTVAALVQRCAGFVGVDNGVKHLAWAFDRPLTYFVPRLPDTPFICRWMPDFHRMLLFGGNLDDVSRNISIE